MPKLPEEDNRYIMGCSPGNYQDYLIELAVNKAKQVSLPYWALSHDVHGIYHCSFGNGTTTWSAVHHNRHLAVENALSKALASVSLDGETAIRPVRACIKECKDAAPV